ncbi:PRTRC system protein F [Paraburkholderia sp. SARCC-3016]|uniref:PRTRC system protein F n=1 Tax=Paraburkholderia sp. SARCC-3016 TaxID=3058611 RepID=UPI002807C260|nr:PRTRC system protein F [Paraburkholderia sp. SARCC-3016]MDQ7980338.1 PRTRC system protein F [Paraburkholderia sp. SARCC-3016]
MLFDPASTDHGIGEGSDRGQPCALAPSRRRPASGFLTLPAVAHDVPSTAFLKFREPASVTALVERQFRYGPLRAYDVKNPTSAADAFQQAFFAWYRRQVPATFQRLTFAPVLFDSAAVLEYTEHCDSSQTSADDPTPLFFGIELPDDHVYAMAPVADQLRAAHPLLLRTVISAIFRAGAQTMWIRAPDWFMYEFSCWYWDGDESITDKDAAELLKDRFDDGEALARFLPSSVRPVIQPDDMSPEFRVVRCRPQYADYLSPSGLRALRNRLTGLPRRVCTALLALEALMPTHRKRDILHISYFTNPVYAPCTLVYQWNGWTEELLDIHYDNAGNSGDGTTYLGFSPLASTSKAIRTQYTDWAHALRVLACLDTLLSLVSVPLY